MYIEINNNRKWKRSVDGIFAGVFQGLGESFNIQPNLLRLLWLVSVLFFGTGLLVYIIMALTLPREDQLLRYEEDKIFGVCKRISALTGLELAVVRFLTVISFIASIGTASIIYLILHFTLPKPMQKFKVYVDN
jgi:phage shock protein C